CAALALSMDVIYEDVWTFPGTAGRDEDTAFAYRHANLATPSPVSAQCAVQWTSSCRIVINYPQHIHPLWSLPRPGTDPVTGLPDPERHTCSRAGCHSSTAAG